jgi:hypothetical protein
VTSFATAMAIAASTLGHVSSATVPLNWRQSQPPSG